MTVPEDFAAARAELTAIEASLASAQTNLTDVRSVLAKIEAEYPKPTPPPVVTPPVTPPTDAVKALLTANIPGLRHEGVMHGVPTNYDWASQSTGPHMTGPSADSQYMNLWGQVYHDGSNAHPANARVNIATCELWRLPASGTTWVRMQGSAAIEGGSWKENYQGTGGTYNQKTEADGTQSVVPQLGYIAHFWTKAALSKAVAGDRAYVVAASTRLVLADTTKPDDRSSARYLIGLGADWRKSDYGCPSVNGVTICNAIGTGKMIYVENNWRRVVYSSLSAAQITALPPLPAAVLTNPDGTIR